MCLQDEPRSRNILGLLYSELDRNQTVRFTVVISLGIRCSRTVIVFNSIFHSERGIRVPSGYGGSAGSAKLTQKSNFKQTTDTRSHLNCF